MPTFSLLTASLTGDRVVLRPAAERDIPEILIAHQDDPQLHVRLGLRRPPSGAELGRRVEHSDAEREAGDGVWLTIVAAGGDDCIGQLDLHDIDHENARAELGMWVAPAHRGRGIGAQALSLATGWLLSDCDIVRVQLLTEPGNAAMRRTARMAGFSEEGVLRAYLKEHAARVDCVILARVAGDPVDA